MPQMAPMLWFALALLFWASVMIFIVSQSALHD